MSLSNAEPYDYILMFRLAGRRHHDPAAPAHPGEFPSLLEVLSDDFKIETVEEDFSGQGFPAGKMSSVFSEKEKKAWRLLTYRGGNLPGVHPDLGRSTSSPCMISEGPANAEIGYEMDITKALDQVNSGDSAAFFLNPTRVEDVEKAALSAQVPIHPSLDRKLGFASETMTAIPVVTRPCS